MSSQHRRPACCFCLSRRQLHSSESVGAPPASPDSHTLVPSTHTHTHTLVPSPHPPTNPTPHTPHTPTHTHTHTMYSPTHTPTPPHTHKTPKDIFLSLSLSLVHSPSLSLSLP